MQRDEQLRTAVAELLGTGALTQDEVVDELVSSGFDTGGSRRALGERLDRVIQLDTTFSDVANRLIHIPTLVEGTTWTVFVDADDAKEDFVRLHPHLDAIGWWLIGEELVVEDAAGRELGTLDVDDGRSMTATSMSCSAPTDGSTDSPAPGRR